MDPSGTPLQYGKINIAESYHGGKMRRTVEKSEPFLVKDYHEAHALVFDKVARLIDLQEAKQRITVTFDLDSSKVGTSVKCVHIAHILNDKED